MKLKESTKQVFKQSRIIALAAALALAGCKGEDGDIGPSGPQGETGPQGPSGAAGAAGASFDKAHENGFIKGTLKGIRRDGTPFEEAFEYKVTTDNAYFEQISGTQHSLSLWRSAGIAQDTHINLDVVVTNKDQAGATAKVEKFYLEFGKMLADRKLFTVNAGSNFIARNILIPMSRTHNATYKLVENGFNQLYYTDDATRQSYYYVKDTDGNSIYFSNAFAYDAVTGKSYSPFKFIVNSNGVKSTTSSVWGNVRMVYTESYIKAFSLLNGTDLSETVATPPDTQEITNFAYNATTGVVTFDYKINISEFRQFDTYYYNDTDPANTTLHPLEIRGSVSATVYNGAVMRKSAQ